VLTHGAPESADLLLRRVGGEAATVPAAPTVTEPLENTYWKLVRLRDEPVIVEPNQREPHIVLHAQGQRVGGSGGCNNLLGGYRLDDNRIAFEKLASTMMACVAGMQQEQRFLEALGETASWRVLGSHLELYDSAGTLLAQFEARHMK
jgi:heat shock protein HslJ